MMELLLLLLPVAAASGWFAARRSQRAESEDGGHRDPAYFRGLNYVLNEQPDKAIDLFIRLLEVDSETVETHLALGNLFRRRGEVDRAIRIHQNLIARPSLSREQRALALLELGQDYMRAGLFDRAESLFRELVEMGVHRYKALSNLKEIYQQEKDWVQCLEVARQLEALSSEPQYPDIARYHCEMAEDALAAGDTAKAWNLCRLALEVDGGCVRATLIQAGMERARGDLRAAIRSYRQVADQDPDLVPEMLPHLIDSCRQQGSLDELDDYLDRLYHTSKNSRILLARADLLAVRVGEGAALQAITDHLQSHADLAVLERYIELKRRSTDVAEYRETLDILQRLVRRLHDKQPAYQCGRCGFSARRLHWQCPGCKGWATVRPFLEPS